MKNFLSRFKRKIPESGKIKDILPKSYPWGTFESVELEQCGLLRINGWSRDDIITFPGLHVYIDGKEVFLANSYRTCRPDIASAFSSRGSFPGFVLEYLFYSSENQEISRIEIDFNKDIIFQLNDKIEIKKPDRSNLFLENKVLHCDDIYGYGPPARFFSEEVFALSKSLHPPIIDFGCGSGALVKALRSAGIDAFGVEIKRQPIIDALFEEVIPYITLYDGSFPLPLSDNSFESGICAEVIEHIDNFEAVIKELTRIVRKRLIVTVPDMSSIPVCHRHHVVPWHLLESTHVNFFTQNSLNNILKRYFPRIEFAKIGAIVINGTRFYTSIVAISDK